MRAAHHLALVVPGRTRPRIPGSLRALRLLLAGAGLAILGVCTATFRAEAAPTWVQLTPAGPTPDPRIDHTAIYDPVRDRMLVFGGGVPRIFYLNDTWELSLAGTPTWSRLSPAGVPPSPRCGHTAIYDPSRDRMLVFGGYSPDGLSPGKNDTWELSLAETATWTKLSPAGPMPPERVYHAAIYDPVRDRMLVFGGTWTFGDSWGGDFNDTWALSLAGTPTWTQLSPSGTPPSPRSDLTAIYDPLRDRMLVFGGSAGIDGNDTWELSLAGTPVWTQLSPSGSPPSRRSDHSAIYDAVRDRMLVFGGTDGSSSYYDTWELSLAGTPTWSRLSPSGALLGAWYAHTAIFDSERDRMLVFGGFHHATEAWALLLAETPVTIGDVLVAPGHGYVDLTWSAFIDAPATLQVWRSTDPDGQYQPVSGELDGRSGRSSYSYRDHSVQPGTEYYYKIGYRESGAWSYSASLRTVTPAAIFGFLGVTPNPAGRGATVFYFELARPGRARLDIYDVAGNHVRGVADGVYRAGATSLGWDGLGADGRPLSAGVYLVKLAANGEFATRKIVVAY